MPPIPRPPASALWRNPAFVRLWTAATISIFGSYITRIAVPFVAILVLGAGPLEMALLRSADLVATLVVGLAAGAWVDRLRRRPVLIWADLGRAAILVSIPVAAVAGVLSLAQLVVVAVSTAVLAVFFDAADNAYLPTIVERPRLVAANAALAASGSAAEFTAFGIGGVLVQALTAPIAILIDAATFLASAVLLGSIRVPEAPAPARADREPVLGEIREGLRLVRHDPILRALAIGQMGLAALWGVYGAMWILFATTILHIGPAVIGLVAAAGGLASLGGAVVAERAVRRIGIGPVVIVALVLAAIGNAFVPLAPAGIPLLAVGCLLAQQVIADSAITMFEVTGTSVRQSIVHDRALGRVSSTVRVAAVTAQLAATIVAGLLGGVIGLRATVALAPLGALVAAVLVWRSPIRGLLALPLREERGTGGDAAAGTALERTGQVIRDAARDEPLGG